MVDKMRWRYGDTNPVVATVLSETIIDIGDMLYQDVEDHTAKPASAQPSQGAGEDQMCFKSYFLGVAMQRSNLGETHPIRVATTGVFEFDCPPENQWNLGDFVAPRAWVSRGLCNQRVALSGHRTTAIGRVARAVPNPTESVLVDIRSTVMTGGV